MEEKRKRKRKERKGKEREKEEKKRKEERKERRGKQNRREKISVHGKGRKKGKEKKRERAGRALSDFQCYDGLKSIGRELKLVYSMRGMSRCQKQKEVGFSHTLVLLNLRAVNGRVVRPQP